MTSPRNHRISRLIRTSVPRRCGDSPRHRVCAVTDVIDLRVPAVLTNDPGTPALLLPKLRGQSPSPGRRCNGCDRSAGSSGSDESSRHTRAATPEAAGTVPVIRCSVTNVTDLRVPAVLTKDPATPALPLPKLRGQSPSPGRAVTDVTDLQVPAVLTKVPGTPALAPPGAGTVPVTGSRCNGCDRSAGSSGSDERSSHTRAATPEAAGTVPVIRCSVTNVTDLRVPAVLTKDPATPALPLPKLRGQSPSPGRAVTDVIDLRVPAVLTKVPGKPALLLPKLRGQSPSPGRAVTDVTDLQVPAVLTKVPGTPALLLPKLRDSPRHRVAL
jgi:hypothetical protein